MGLCLQRLLWWTCDSRQKAAHPEPPLFCARGQFPLIWTTPVLRGGQRWGDFHLRLWCKIRKVVNRCRWWPSLLNTHTHTHSCHHFYLVYSTIGRATSQRWHFGGCWDGKNNMSAAINGALWTHPKVTLSVVRGCGGRKRGGGKKNDDVMSAALVNVRL